MKMELISTTMCELNIDGLHGRNDRLLRARDNTKAHIKI